MAHADQWNRRFDALGRPYRRRLLVALLNDNPQDVETAFGVEKEPEVSEIQRYHIHLPKLEAAGYISWDRPNGAIERGPNWLEIEPLLVFLQDTADGFPNKLVDEGTRLHGSQVE